MREMLSGFTGEVEIVSAAGEGMAMWRSEEVEHGADVMPYAVLGGMAIGDDAMQGVLLRGVDGTYDWRVFEKSLTEGRLPEVDAEERKPEILISRALADRLKVGVDDRLEMLFVQTDGPPRRYPFKVTGIYHTGFRDMELRAAMTDIRNVQRLARMDSMQITGYEVSAGSDVDVLPAGTMRVDVEQRYPQLFDWLRAHDVNAAVIIVIMIAVAFLNMGSALLIILLEKMRMIGLLKALGMTNGALRRVFVLRSGAIVFRGMIWGNVVGLGLCLAQKWGHFVKLNATGYFLSEVPIDLGAGWLLVLNAGAFALIVGLLIIPTLVISRISPEKTIRFQ